MTRSQDDAAPPDPARGETIEEIYDRYAPQVERWARRLAGPGLDAEDLLHDIFLVVMRRRHEFRGEAKITTWLFCITQNVVRWRRRKDALRRFLAERALWGRAQGRLAGGDRAGGQEDAALYLRRHPRGRFAAPAARLAGVAP
jgi:RNA polymerase sigma-70 factor (ECF subfamily)